MTATFPPATIRTWQYHSTRGGLETNLNLNTSSPLPKPNSNQHLVQILAVCLNPVDYKPAEIPLANRVMISRPATPGIDIAGCIVTPASGSPLKRGDLVFGCPSNTPLAGGALTEFAVCEKGNVVAVPEGLSAIDASTVCVAGLTAYQTIVPRVKKGDKVLINGGSGGVGVFGIQIAKVVGCHVTATCSTANVELCKGLGADVVVDYKKGSVAEALKVSGVKFDHVLDNVGGSDLELYWKCHEYTRPGAVYMAVGGTPSVGYAIERMKIKMIPSFLGGGKRKIEGFFAVPVAGDLSQIGAWMAEGKVKAVIDSKFSFEEAPKAFERLKTGRARGKIVVDIALETYHRS